MAVASLAITAIGTGASIDAQKKNADAQTKANKRNAEAAQVANNAEQAAINNEQQQQAEVTGETINANNKAGLKAMSSSVTSAGEAGVSGRSVDFALRELAGLNATDNLNASTQYLRGDAGMEARRTNSTNGANSVINNLKTPDAPDYLGAALKIGSAAITYKSKM
jgi:hypothetical protein